MTQITGAISRVRQTMRQQRLTVLFVTTLVTACSIVTETSHALERYVYDCSTNTTSNCKLNFFSSIYNYTFGRSEGHPAIGPNPAGPPFHGLTEVDELYDLAGVVDQYYQSRFNRNGPNGFGGTGDGTNTPVTRYRFYAYVDNVTSPPLTGSTALAFPSQGYTLFAATSVTPDIFGHEMSHFMSAPYLTSNLADPPVGETGAISESLADFFGEALERHMAGSNDWVSGFGTGARSLSSPSSVIDSPPEPVGPYPDRYLDPNFYTGAQDSGGVHHNSTVLSKAAYLAVEGGTFMGYTISGIGFDKVEQIWYRATNNYFHPGESFNQAYDDIIRAASDLYPANDVWELTKALRAVELNMSRSFAGDFNNNGSVDAADYVTWRHGLGTEYSLASYDIWRNNFGVTTAADSPIRLGTQPQTSLPEPTLLSLLVPTVLLLRRSAWQ